MLKRLEDVAPVGNPLLLLPEFLQPMRRVGKSAIAPTDKLDKPAIRTSLKASILDGAFSTFFSCVTAEVLLSNFLLELGATNLEIGLLSAIPMLANFLQPVGAYLADRTTSRHWYTLQTFIPSRLLWLVVVVGIVSWNTHLTQTHQLVQWTLLIALVTHIFGALGSPSWVSWMAVLVPRRLRGRYFGVRNSVSHCTNMLCVPLLGLAVSNWEGGTTQGYGAILILGILAGVISLGFQFFMVDVNPQASAKEITTSPEVDPTPPVLTLLTILKDRNFLRFLLYFGLWMFAVNLSAPFFTIYLLKDLGLDVSWVTLYSSLTAGANLLMLVMWGKLADRIGNRPLLICVGILVAVIPLLWLGTGTDTLSLLLWLPLLYLLAGGTLSAIDLCSNNLQMEIAPVHKPPSYFAIAAAVSGLGGALGTTAGGLLVEFADLGGIPGLFALSAVLRLVALFPLIFVREPRSLDLEKLLSHGIKPSRKYEV